MRLARLHIYFTTVTLPNRRLSDVDNAHDVIDMEISDRERVVQVDLVEGPVYIQVPTPPSDNPEMRALAPATKHTRMKSVRNKNMSTFRARVVTIEEVDAVNADEARAELPSGAEVHDAEVIDESTDLPDLGH